ncbi:MAG: hypothetical protein KDG55_02375 [Rhodocyclaceae bacterium]|nr:hypothetical protein [Rhodocyclaceae bacterium]
MPPLPAAPPDHRTTAAGGATDTAGAMGLAARCWQAGSDLGLGSDLA